MTVSPTTGPSLTVIGENIHCTRVALRKGKRIAERDGAEAILYRSADGVDRALAVTEEAKRTKDYEEGRVKHVQVAIETAMETAAGDPAEGMRYIEALVRHQERAGAAFLDLNVDEMSPKLAVQTGAMAWLAATVQGLSDLPLSIDSSSVDVIRAGLEALAPPRARPMLNSASLERLDALDLARAHDCRVVVTAAGERGCRTAPRSGWRTRRGWWRRPWRRGLPSATSTSTRWSSPSRSIPASATTASMRSASLRARFGATSTSPAA